jgi:hypothetical protein
MSGINGAPRVAPAPPDRTLLVVNGLPGSGKTTLAKRVSRLCGVPVYSKDAIKDMLAEAEPVEPDPAWLSERALQAMPARCAPSPHESFPGSAAC